ncbi:MFS transporter [Nonomuraea sp. NPDC050536]|uniref:MFS transporter n=1 Tax=Nonomuraea sp. NPDC050536 TaxID=3364366 RepID=UPI0037C61AD2
MNIPIRTLAVGTFAVGTDAFVVAGFLPAMAASLGVSPAAAGQSVTVFAAAYAAGSPVLATLTAKLPRRPLLVSALVVLGLANLGSALAPNLAVLMVTRVVAAFGAAAYTPNAGAVSASLVGPEKRARALSVVVGGLTIATALGVPLGGLAGRLLGWRPALGLVAAVCLLVACCVRAVLPTLPGNPRVTLRTRLGALRRPGVLPVLGLTVLGMAASYTAYAYSAPALAAVGITTPAPMLFVYGVGAIAGNLAAGRATDRWNALVVLRSGYALMAAALAALALLAATGATIPALVGVLMTAWGASSWCQTPPQQHRLIGIAPDAAALLVSLNSSCIYLGIGLGTALGALTLPAVFAVGAALAVLAIPLTAARTR